MQIAWVDTIDVCHLKCPTCIRGVRGMPNTSAKMDLETFAAIAARLKQQGYDKVGLLNWTEPFLNRNLEDYVATAKTAGLWVLLCSTLSLPHIDNLEETLAAGLDQITVTISGMDQETYAINHVGGDLSHVMQNLTRIREIRDRRALPLQVDLRFLQFDYNTHQAPQARDYAESLGFRFDPLDGVGHPSSTAVAEQDDAHYLQLAAAAARIPSPEDQGKACELMFNQMAIDCHGDVYICCAMPDFPSLRIGNFLQMTADEILAARFRHPFCRACTMPRRDRSPAEDSRLKSALNA
jgi:MoaA/NifB/PqqE/SkfB family radical SAM enzyme